MLAERIEIINSTIQKIIGEVIQKELDLPSSVMITITQVDTTGDLSLSKVYLSIIPHFRAEEIIIDLRKEIKLIQNYLFKHLPIKKVPKLQFEIDETALEADRIEKLLKQIKEEGA